MGTSILLNISFKPVVRGNGYRFCPSLSAHVSPRINSKVFKTQMELKSHEELCDIPWIRTLDFRTAYSSSKCFVQIDFKTKIFCRQIKRKAFLNLLIKEIFFNELILTQKVWSCVQNCLKDLGNIKEDIVFKVHLIIKRKALRQTMSCRVLQSQLKLGIINSGVPFLVDRKFNLIESYISGVPRLTQD